ncbi:myosin-2 heavy chain, non muscle isoform X2 [Abrus precatorius]|uniref:Myosin-2 heavy chain, non muscle isoform X2 n=1 Tax=Abrus precatorius TaxID=3816 RepID=A0A8B8MA37_ABRPR|nr:myosin-2 heavy chain, non muscle isoform X2 [Abrus precatorius]
MGEKGISVLDRIGCDNKSDIDSMYPKYFGVSCAFFALQVLSETHVEVERWSKIRDTMLQGSAQLLGLIVWNVQKGMPNGGECKLKSAEREIENLKRMRHEDAKANEKVVGIFAAQEQSWLSERRKLRQQIGALLNELRVFEKNKDADISELNQKLKDMEDLVESRDKEIEQEEQKGKELEEKIIKAEKDAEELRESARREAQEHSSDLRKHKTAFIELVSNQRQLEAELGRAVKQLEATKEELASLVEKKEESDLMSQKLSVEIAKFHKDLEQKDKILSAMLRKSKLDTAEKQMLLKEVKLSKARRKHAEQETEKWKAVSEGKHDRHSLKSMLVNLSSRMDVFPGARGMQPSSTGSSHIAKEPDQNSLFSDNYLQQRSGDLSIPANAKRLEDWMRAEAERYATLIEQRHHLELDAFAEQMRLKDEKLEAFRWQLLRTELETKQLQSHVEGLVKDVTHLRHDKMKLETLLLEREDELNSLKEQFASKLRPLNCIRNNSNLPPQSSEVAQDAVWSRVKIVKKKPGELEMMETLIEEECEKEVQCLPHDHFNNANLLVQSPENEIEEAKDDSREDRPAPMQNQSPTQVEIDASEKIASTSHPFISKTKQSSWKMDLHALGVSYKIKRLKQQLILVERLTGKQTNDEQAEINDDSKVGMKAYLSLTSLLNKQLGRYQSLQEKTDDLCKRMHENDLYANRGDMNAARTKEKTSTLEHFLEETFQLQRYIVATGQKLMEIQSKIVSGFVGVAEEMEKSAGIDMKRFADSIRNLFQEVQRGLEVRTARIIGDLEGTLAREGMICFRS